MQHITALEGASQMIHIAALPAPVLLHRTVQYDSVRASLAPCTVHHLETPVFSPVDSNFSM